MACICGNPNCNGLCDAGIGKSIYDFYIKWNEQKSILKTSIGEKDTDADYIYIGMEYTNDNNPKQDNFSYILKSKDKVPYIRIENPFNLQQMSIHKYLLAYKNKSGADINSALIGYDDLCRNATMLVPVELDSRVLAVINIQKKDKIEQVMTKGTVQSLRLKLDNDLRPECLLKIKSEDTKSLISKTVDLLGTEYFNLLMSHNSNKVIKQIIKMNRFGYIQPIVIERGNGFITIIDNKNVYNGEYAKLDKVGTLFGGRIILDKKYNLDTRVVKLLYDNMNAICYASSRMAPYMLGKNTVANINSLI